MDDVERPDPSPLPRERDPVSDIDAPAWPLWKRIGFRLLALYFLLYTIPFPLSQIPWLGGKLSSGVTWVWQRAALWLGKSVLGIEREIPLGPTGSGDMTIHYLIFLVMVGSAFVGTLVWSLVDRRRVAYPAAARWLVVGTSFYLGVVLLSYGFAKVIPSQFSVPNLERLLQTYGSSSPMRLVWTFMGLSPAYTIFSGLAEVVPGVLLFFRRTRLLGALLAAAVMLNVAMINYCFDVPVKLFSTHLLAMTVGLISLHRRRLVAFFLRDRPAPPSAEPPLFAAASWRIAGAIVGVLVVAPTVWSGVFDGLEGYRMWGQGRPRPAIYGIYDVELFRLAGEELPPLLTDERRWRALVVDRALPIKTEQWDFPGRIVIQRMNGELTSRAVELDEEGGAIHFLPQGQTSVGAAREAGEELAGTLRYERPEPGRLIVRGTLDGEELEVELAARPLEEMQLITRGYRWINEYPHNR